MKNVATVIGKIFKFIGKLIALLVLVAILAPIIYFAWRAGQPMSMPEYDGRTYYELLAERRQAYADLAAEYQASHPNVDVKDGMCFQAEMIVILSNTFPWSGLCAASEIIPELRIYGEKSQKMGGGNMGGTWINFSDTWWHTFEALLYADIFSTRSQGPVPYCRIPAP